MKLSKYQLRRMILKEIRLLTESEKHELTVHKSSKKGTAFTVKKSGKASLSLKFHQGTPRKLKVIGYSEDGRKISYESKFKPPKPGETLDLELDAGDYRIVDADAHKL